MMDFKQYNCIAKTAIIANLKKILHLLVFTSVVKSFATELWIQ